jgi:hypothetical protein
MVCAQRRALTVGNGQTRVLIETAGFELESGGKPAVENRIGRPARLIDTTKL